MGFEEPCMLERKKNSTSRPRDALSHLSLLVSLDLFFFFSFFPPPLFSSSIVDSILSSPLPGGGEQSKSFE